MLGKFWESVGGSLADRWMAVSGPALIFWLAGALAWAHSRGGRPALASWAAWFTHQPGIVQAVLLVAALAVAGASGLVVGRLTGPALRLAEGYWPLWSLRVWYRVAGRPAGRGEAAEARWQELRRRIDEGDPALDPEHFSEFLRLDRRRRREPAVPWRRMPTRTGTILRSAESWPYDKYGLETTAVWPRLWLVLPQETRDELVAARRAVNGSVAAALWGLLFTGFAALTPWAAPAGLLVAVLALRVWLPDRAQTFGDLLESAFDVHRTLLYRSLRWPLPRTPAEERTVGLAVTAYLWRGSDEPAPTYLDPS